MLFPDIGVEQVLIPLAMVLLSNIRSFSLPLCAVILSRYTTWPSISVISKDTSSSVVAPLTEPLIVNSPLFGLGSMEILLPVFSDATPSPATVMITQPAPAQITNPVARYHATYRSPFAKLSLLLSRIGSSRYLDAIYYPLISKRMVLPLIITADRKINIIT